MTASALLVSPQGRLRAGWRAIVFIVLLVILTAFVQQLGHAAIRPFWGASDIVGWEPSGFVQWLRGVLPYLSLVLGAVTAHWVLLHYVDRTGWSYVDLGRRAVSGRALAGGLALGAAAIGTPCLLLIGVHWLAIEGSSAGATATGREALAALALLVPAALAEELMVRGYLLSAIADGLGRWWALGITSILFALLHLGNPGMTPQAIAVVALAGVFLGAVRFATASLYAAWAAHLAWNAVLAIALHAAVSGQWIARAGWQTVDNGPDWATGGAWGPEGGAAAVLGLLAATSLLIIRRPRVAGTNDTSNA